MIKTNELRIGNYILFKEYGKGKGRIGQIKPGDFSRMAGDDPEESEYHPIPLTSEWLEKFGFVDDLPWKKDNFRIDSENRFIVVDSTGYGIIIARHILYVHQLQNLIFALTGEELNVKL